MSMSRFVQQGLRLGQRQLGTSSQVQAAKGEVHPGYAKIKEKYAQFQIDDGTPVHLKGGPKDVMLYYLTLGLCAVGVVGCADFIYRSSFPKKC